MQEQLPNNPCHARQMDRMFKQFAGEWLWGIHLVDPVHLV
jgi:hypothetical protein